jgi:hypothetical protein
MGKYMFLDINSSPPAKRFSKRKFTTEAGRHREIQG